MFQNPIVVKVDNANAAVHLSLRASDDLVHMHVMSIEVFHAMLHEAKVEGGEVHMYIEVLRGVLKMAYAVPQGAFDVMVAQFDSLVK